MRVVSLLTILVSVHGFGFGNLFGISLPPIPSGLLPTELPIIPELLSGFPIFPTAFPDIELPSVPVLTSRLPIISVPPIPSFEILEIMLPSLAIPSEVDDMLNSIKPFIDNVMKSLDVSSFPTIDRNAIASLRGAVPSFDDVLQDARDGIQEFVESYRGVQNRSLLIPSSESELRNLIRNKTTFDMERLDSFVDSLGSKTGYDVAPSIRMIVGMVLQNTSSVYERVTGEFSLHATNLRYGVQQVFNFSNSRIILPASLPNLQNKSLSFLQYASNPYDALSDTKINSSVISIMISDIYSGNETVITGLQDSINFTIPGDYSDFVSSRNVNAACVYWNNNVADWSTDGCILTDITIFIATCSCNHLTDFAVAATSVMPSIVSNVPIASSPEPIAMSVVPIASSPEPIVMSVVPTAMSVVPIISSMVEYPSVSFAYSTSHAVLIAAPLPVGIVSGDSPNSIVVGGVVGGILGCILVFGGLGYAMYRADRRKRIRRLTLKVVQEKNPCAGV